ncbi:MAG: triose-phosphate isomerase [Planctomycetes bacterium]|nr:triose-phosphate isomerase [Planctomycetota bacterium]
MHTSRAEAVALASGVVAQLQQVPAWDPDVVRVGLAPPFPFLEAVRDAVAGHPVELVAQDCHAEPRGAFTGWVSAPMLASVGVRRVIVGHSERRQHAGEDDALVRRKLEAALEAGLDPVVCVGEQLAERDAGRHEAVVEAQARGALEGLDPAAYARVVVAYEPVWAIGTGRTATPEQAGTMHRFIGGLLASFGPQAAGVPVIYGGSVKPDNIDGLARQDGIAGALVGGASLEAGSFVQIVRGVAEQARAGARS